MTIPTLAEVQAFCESLGLTKQDGEVFWLGKESNGWTSNGKRMISWERTILAWKAAGYMHSQKQGTIYGGARSQARGENPLNRGTCEPIIDYAEAAKRKQLRQEDEKRRRAMAQEMARRAFESPTLPFGGQAA